MHLIDAVKADAINCPAQADPVTDEQQLIEQLRRGDRRALEQIIAEHQPHVRRLVGRLSGWSSDTDDLVQDVFVAALGSAGTFQGGSRIGTWLTRIAINRCRSHYRTRMFRIAFWSRWRQQASPPPDADASEPAEQRERAARVMEAVRRLPARYREVVVLHYLEGQKIDQLAALLRLSRNAVEVRLHRGRRMLHETLADLMEDMR